MFIKEEVEKVGVQKAVLGLSGGVDSAVSCYLAVNALGPENVVAIEMPYKQSSRESVEHAELVIKDLNIKAFYIDISRQIDSYFDKNHDADNLRRGNKMARERMSILYDFSAKFNALVVGTSNKTELMLGYGTLFGDTASALNPLGDLYKTQVWELARYLEVPQEIIDKPPSADLWEGQTDEAELGFTYEELDAFLYHYIDCRYSNIDLLGAGYEQEFIDKITKRVRQTQYKRRLPLIAKTSRRTIGIDFNYERDWGV